MAVEALSDTLACFSSRSSTTFYLDMLVVSLKTKTQTAPLAASQPAL